MAFDYKKEYKEYYMPKNTPQIVQVPKMNFLAVRGVGDPNEKDDIVLTKDSNSFRNQQPPKKEPATDK